MASLMDILMQRQARGYDVQPSAPSGPSIVDILLQREKRGYGKPAAPQAQPQYSGMGGGYNTPREMMPPSGAAPAAIAQPQYSGMGGGYDTPREMMPRSGGGASGSFRALPGYEGEGAALFNTFRSLPGYEGEGMPAQAAAPRGRQVSQAPMGPVNMNVIKGLNQYAQMGDAQAYADQFAKGDLSKVKARTYRNEDGSTFNDYYVSGLLGG